MPTEFVDPVTLNAASEQLAVVIGYIGIFWWGSLLLFAIYKKLKSCNANVQLTLFDDANHDSWSRVYDNQEIYDWMFQQIKK